MVDDGSARRHRRAGRATVCSRGTAHAACCGIEPIAATARRLRTGFEAARYDLVAFTDADCQFDLADLAQLAPLAAEYPIVAGYRADRKDPWRRRFFSWGYNRLARTLLGTRVRDVDCALKVFRRGALAELLPESRGFFVNTEMMTRARQLGFDVAEVPVTHRPRAAARARCRFAKCRERPRSYSGSGG